MTTSTEQMYNTALSLAISLAENAKRQADALERIATALETREEFKERISKVEQRIGAMGLL